MKTSAIYEKVGSGLPDGDKGSLTISHGGELIKLNKGVVTEEILADEAVTPSKLKLSGTGRFITGDFALEDIPMGDGSESVTVEDGFNDFMYSDISGLALEIVSFGNLQKDVANAVGAWKSEHDSSIVLTVPVGFQAPVWYPRQVAGGLPFVRFASNSKLQINNFNIAATQDITLWAVVRKMSDSTIADIVRFLNNTTGFDLKIQGYNYAELLGTSYYDGNINAPTNTPKTIMVSQLFRRRWQILRIHFWRSLPQGNELAGYLNGANATQLVGDAGNRDVQGNFPTTSTLSIGAGDGAQFELDLGRMLLYGRIMTNAETAKIDSEITTEWQADISNTIYD